MRYLNDYSDERFKGICVHCGTGILGHEVNNDHVPSKCLLQEPYPDNLPVLQSCTSCNSDFSKDEQYFSVFLQCVLTGSTNPKDHHIHSTRKALLRSAKLRERIECSKLESESGDEVQVSWEPERERVNRVVVKNARGHAFYEIGERPDGEPTFVHTVPLNSLSDTQRHKFDGPIFSGLVGWPEVGSRAMQRAALGSDLCNDWVIVQENVYRYQVEQYNGTIVKSILMEYLATEVYWSDD